MNRGQTAPTRNSALSQPLESFRTRNLPPGFTTTKEMATIKKRDLVIKISADTGLTQAQVMDVLQNFLDTSTAELSKGNQVVLRNFGTFQVVEQRAKKGRNPANPAVEMDIPARAIVKFRPGKELKAKVGELMDNDSWNIDTQFEDEED